MNLRVLVLFPVVVLASVLDAGDPVKLGVVRRLASRGAVARARRLLGPLALGHGYNSPPNRAQLIEHKEVSHGRRG